MDHTTPIQIQTSDDREPLLRRWGAIAEVLATARRELARTHPEHDLKMFGTYLEHNELGLAYEELARLVEVPPVDPLAALLLADAAALLDDDAARTRLTTLSRDAAARPENPRLALRP